MPDFRPLSTTATLIALLATGGCGWVDATGRQAGDAGEGPSPRGLPITVAAEEPLALTEETPMVVRLAETDGDLTGWRWRTLDEPGDPATCAGLEGFDATLAERTLQAACSDATACALRVTESRDADGVRFELRLPALRAPVAARVALSTVDRDGRPVEREQSLCGLSVNEAPEARDDRYTMIAGTTLEVQAVDGEGLLANDRDDIDVRNAPLSVDRQVASAPRHAELFALAADGGFVYRPRADAIERAGGALEDRFTYTVTDGLFEVMADVVIDIRRDDFAANTPPQALEPLPDVEYVLDGKTGANVRLDLSRRFTDPDGDTLSFSVREGSLPPGGGLRFSDAGVLAGRLGDDDVGGWRVTVIVDDGRDRIEADFTLDVVRAVAANRPPSVTDIANRTYDGRVDYDVAPFFDDPDGDRLNFTAAGLPRNVSIDDAGVISGRARRRDRGDSFVVVTATDGRGGEVSDGFRLTIE